MKNAGKDRTGINTIRKSPAELPADPAAAQRRIRKMEGRYRRRVRQSVIAVIVASALFLVFAAGFKITSDNEQAIRLALGQKNYKEEGEEGAQYFAGEYTDPEELRADSAELGQRILREGIVLLRNENDVLPLRKGAAVSVFGKAAVRPLYSSSVSVTGAPTLKDALEEQKIRVNDKLWTFTDRGGSNTFSGNVEKSMEEFSEAAIVVIGRSGSSADLFEPAYSDEEEPKVTGAKALQLTAQERELLAYVDEHFDSVIVVLNTENPMEMGFLDEYGVDGCLWMGGTGAAGMKALAEVLSGSVNPSGHLPDTFVYNSLSAPAAANLGDYTIQGSEEEFGDKYLAYAEGIYVGYRYYETRYEDAVLGIDSGTVFDYDKEVAFPFGFGLSYTEFKLGNMKMEPGKKSGYEVTVDVENIGSRAGMEVVQIYVQKPYTQNTTESGTEVPSVELAGFAKTRSIGPGESEKVKIAISEEAFKTFDVSGSGTYVIEGGNYLVTAAQNAHAAVNNILLYKSRGGSAAFRGEGDGGLVERLELVRDLSTYSVSAQTGESIGRTFSAADPAQYDSDYQGLTRSLWGRTWPVTFGGGSYPASSSFLELLKVSSKEDNKAEATVYNKAHGEKNAGLVNLRDADFDDYRWDSLLDQLTWRETYSLVRKGGGVVNEVISCISPQGLISRYECGLSAEYDGERGFIYPSVTVLAAAWNTDLALQLAQLMGEEALRAQVTFQQIPSLGLHRTAMGGRNCDSFSEDCFLAGKMAAAMCRGLGAKGVIPVLGSLVLADQESSGTGTVVLAGEQAIRELYLKPFEIALREGGTGMKAVMAGMNRLGPRWCGGHAGLLNVVLRGEWGFNGIVMTDRLTGRTAAYADILEGLEAGTDLWQNTSNNNFKLKGVQLTYGVRARFRKAAGRILQTISRSNAMNGIGKETTLKYSAPLWKKIRMAVLGLAGLLLAAICWFAFVQARKARNIKAKIAVEKRELERNLRR